MKKIALLTFLCLMSFVANAQMVGQFNYGNDGRLYLFLQNSTNYTLTFKGAVYSPLRKTGNSETCTVYPGNGIYLGPTTPWRWQWCEGDRYTITYPNGYTQTWTCPTNDYKGMTFGKGPKCHVPVGASTCGKVGTCPGFEEYTYATCKHCGHARSKHY